MKGFKLLCFISYSFTSLKITLDWLFARLCIKYTQTNILLLLVVQLLINESGKNV